MKFDTRSAPVVSRIRVVALDNVCPQEHLLAGLSRCFSHPLRVTCRHTQ